MHLDLDVPQLRSCLALWRQTADPRGDMRSQRAAALARLAATMAAWLDLLRLCEAHEAVELRALALEIATLRDWADEAAIALRLMDEAIHL
jgi:hypothetical protein